MNMFAKNKATTVEGYLAAVPEDRKPTIDFLHEFIQENATSLKPHFAYNMLGYGNFKYLDYKKQERDWPVVALANQKNYVSIYICALDGKEYLAEKYKDKLGKVNVGKSCIRFKKLEDLNIGVLTELLRESEKSLGLLNAEKRDKTTDNT